MNRCRHDIIASILESVAEEPLRLSRIALESNLPYDRAKRIVTDLVNHGLLIYDPETRTYTPTELGYQWLGIYRELENLYSRYTGSS
ncbi:MAG: hypothetical protein GSR82_00900 [Desulfurococcales archaeon]|nr:hypothetical protein [Desulfurococcales archaeon]